MRDKALSALELYLCSGRPFTPLDLLKLWRGLYFCMYHTPLARAGPLISSVTSLTLALPPPLLLPFSRAFWLTVAEQHPLLDAHRIDKYLLLMRRFVGVQLEFLRRQKWDQGLLEAFLSAVADRQEGPLGVGGEGEVVGDGIRYHVLDVWVDEIEKVWREEDDAAVLERLQGPVEGLARKGRTKILRDRAKEVLANERWAQLKERSRR